MEAMWRPGPLLGRPLPLGSAGVELVDPVSGYPAGSTPFSVTPSPPIERAVVFSLRRAHERPAFEYTRSPIGCRMPLDRIETTRPQRRARIPGAGACELDRRWWRELQGCCHRQDRWLSDPRWWPTGVGTMMSIGPNPSAATATGCRRIGRRSVAATCSTSTPCTLAARAAVVASRHRRATR